MKAKFLILITIVLIASACQVKKEMLTLDNPTIKIKDINVINSEGGKVICYTINLYSPSSLSEFVAIPNIEGANKDSVTKFQFDNHARRATVVYYYAVPEQTDVRDIIIRFCLNNNIQETNDVKLLSSL